MFGKNDFRNNVFWEILRKGNFGEKRILGKGDFWKRGFAEKGILGKGDLEGEWKFKKI